MRALQAQVAELRAQEGVREEQLLRLLLRHQEQTQALVRQRLVEQQHGVCVCVCARAMT